MPGRKTRPASNARATITPKSAQSTNSTGDPRVSVQNGIVHIAGGMTQTIGDSNQTFAVLPAAYRPAHNVWLPVYAGSNTAAGLSIGHDGTMQVSSPNACDATGTESQCFTVLTAVSYPKGA